MLAGQIAEVMATRADGRRFRGSGYRITPSAILTAWHVVRDTASVSVRFDVGRPSQWSAEAAQIVPIPRTDLAIVTVSVPIGRTSVTAPSFGRLADEPARIPVSFAGFPRWKLRRVDTGSLRELHHAYGTASVLSNRRGGTLEITVDAPGPDSDASPWEGTSGSAVWAGEAIIAVLSEHHPREGLGRLTAVRIDHAADQLQPAEYAELAGLFPSSFSPIVTPSSSPSTQVNIATGTATQFNVQGGSINVFRSDMS